MSNRIKIQKRSFKDEQEKEKREIERRTEPVDQIEA